MLTDAAPRAMVVEAPYAELVDGLRARLRGIEGWFCIGPPAACPPWAESYENLLNDPDAADEEPSEPLGSHRTLCEALSVTFAICQSQACAFSAAD